MPSSSESRKGFLKAVTGGLRSWLNVARDRVMAPWKQFKAQPNPSEIQATAPLWQAQVDTILEALTPALREGWAAANLPGSFDINDPYIQANLALTRNLLVRIPDEVHAQVVKEILEGVSRHETTAQIAQRIDSILNFTGSENWLNRARVIAQTELTRHFSGSMLAHGLLREHDGERGLQKQWVTRMDGKERDEHAAANEQTVPLSQPFRVGGESLLFPGQPGGRPDNVINCRCHLRILRGSTT